MKKTKNEFRCFCGKYKGEKYKYVICDVCGTYDEEFDRMRLKVRAIDNLIDKIVDEGKKDGFVDENKILDFANTIEAGNSYGVSILEDLYEKLEFYKIKVKQSEKE